MFAMPLFILADHLPDIAMVFLQPAGQGRSNIKTCIAKNMIFRQLSITFSKNLLVKIVVMIASRFSRNQTCERVSSWRLIDMEMHSQIAKSVGNRTRV